MKHLIFSNNNNSHFNVAILIKESYLRQDAIKEYYINPLVNYGLKEEDFVAFSLHFPNNKVTATQAKKYINDQLLPALVMLGVTTLYVADATYFKLLTGLKKADQNMGYIKPCKIKGYEHISVCYGLNYQVLVHNPNSQARLDLSLQTLSDHLTGSLKEIGADTLRDPIYLPKTALSDIDNMLSKLLEYPLLTCDVETFGLRIDSGGLGTIAFSWNEHNGVAIQISDTPNHNSPILRKLKVFFEKYRGKLIFHNATFDIKQIIYNCFMKAPLDKVGMLHGLEVMTRDIHDTKIIAYLALNSCAGNELGLKTLVHPFLGNYGVDVEDITKINTSDLLEYNLKDCIGTFYVFNKYYPLMVMDEQLPIYQDIMISMVKLIVHIELVGMPLDMDRVLKAEVTLKELEKVYMKRLEQSKYYIEATQIMRERELVSLNKKLKVKQHGFDKVADKPFNPNSDNQLAILVYEVMQMPVIDYTPTRNPATGAKTLAKLVNHTKDTDKINILNDLIGLSKVVKILSTFIPVMKKAQLKEDGHHYLHGNFNITGTLSARLSCSSP